MLLVSFHCDEYFTRWAMNRCRKSLYLLKREIFTLILLYIVRYKNRESGEITEMLQTEITIDRKND